MMSFSVKYRNKMPVLSNDPQNKNYHAGRLYIASFAEYSCRQFRIKNFTDKVMVITFYQRQRHKKADK
jgi:hypothetical protein